MAIDYYPYQDMKTVMKIENIEHKDEGREHEDKDKGRGDEDKDDHLEALPRSMELSSLEPGVPRSLYAKNQILCGK